MTRNDDRLDVESRRELRRLVWLHGAQKLIDAIHEIELGGQQALRRGRRPAAPPVLDHGDVVEFERSGAGPQQGRVVAKLSSMSYEVELRGGATLRIRASDVVRVVRKGGGLAAAVLKATR